MTTRKNKPNSKKYLWSFDLEPRYGGECDLFDVYFLSSAKCGLTVAKEIIEKYNEAYFLTRLMYLGEVEI